MVRLLSVCIYSFLGAALAVAYEPEQPVVDINGVIITPYDIARYTEFNLSAEARLSGLERERALLQVIENLYVLRRAAQEQASQDYLPPEQLAWVAGYERTRYAAIRYFDANRDTLSDSIDWEQRARELYLSNPEGFSTGKRVDVSHILIEIENRTFDEWVSLVQDIRTRLSAGESFEALAGELSDDAASARKGGALGPIYKGQMVTEFEAAAFALTEPGQVSEPVFSKFGVHIVRLNSLEEATLIPFDRVQRGLEREAKESAQGSLKEQSVLPFKIEVGPSIQTVDEESLREVVLRLINTDW